jgi:hypothetical protein
MPKYNFKKDKLCFFKKALSLDLTNFMYKYLLLKRNVFKTMNSSKYISPFNQDFGKFGDDQCQQTTFCIYGDPAGDTILTWVQSLIEKEVGSLLIPTYSYARVYEKGDVLKRHVDRASCEISGTIFLGGEEWPIYIDPTGKTKQKGIKMEMKPGDMLIYSGSELEHWRNKFKGTHCVQIFIHFNRAGYGKSEFNKFDSRPMLGLPRTFTKNTN